MAKKSKAKKRKQTQKRVNQAKPSKTQKSTTASVTTDQALPVEELEAENLDSMMNEAAPREPLNQRWIIYALIAVVLLLGIVLFVMYQKTNDLRQNTANTGQDQLLQVHQSDQNSLQPTAPTDSSTTPQGSSNPQDNTGGATQLQPQSSPDQNQLNQMQ